MCQSPMAVAHMIARQVHASLAILAIFWFERIAGKLIFCVPKLATKVSV